jgi:hypothetical protein
MALVTQSTVPAWKLPFNWLTLDRLLVGLFFAAVFGVGATLNFQSDSWWQLRSGQLIWQSGQIWKTDPFSWTARGAYWPNHEWLTQVLYYGLYRLAGLGGVVLFSAGVITLTWGLLYRLCSGIPRLSRMLLLLLGVPTHIIVWSVRPHLLTLLLMALLLVLMRHRPLHGLIPPLFLVWANLHGGVGMGGLALVVMALAAWIRSRSDWLRFTVITGLSAAATLVNPLGLGLWRFSLGMLNHPQTTYIQEWMSPRLDWPASYPFFALAGAWLVLLVVRRRHVVTLIRQGKDPWLLGILMLGSVYLVLGLTAIRHTALFTIAALPLMAQLGGAFLPSLSITHGWRRGAIYAVLGFVVFELGIIQVVSTVHTLPERCRPLSPAALARIADCPGPLYNSYDLGGPMIWFAPQRPVFVDSRNDPYPLPFLYESVMVEQSGRYQDLFERYEVKCAVVQPQRALATTLAHDPAWQELYRDDQAAVFSWQRP